MPLTGGQACGQARLELHAAALGVEMVVERDLGRVQLQCGKYNRVCSYSKATRRHGSKEHPVNTSPAQRRRPVLEQG